MTERQARAIFLDQKRRFVRLFPWCRQVQFVIHDSRHSLAGGRAFRDVAWADPEDCTVNLLYRALAWEPARIVAVIAHELGHFADRQWDAPGAERRADRLAARALRRPILYDEDALQNIERGSPVRPSHLHQ